MRLILASKKESAWGRLLISCQEEYLQSKTKNPRECKLNQQNGCITHISVQQAAPRNIPVCKQAHMCIIQFNELPTGFSANTFDHRPQRKNISVRMRTKHADDVKDCFPGQALKLIEASLGLS